MEAFIAWFVAVSIPAIAIAWTGARTQEREQLYKRAKSHSQALCLSLVDWEGNPQITETPFAGSGWGAGTHAPTFRAYDINPAEHHLSRQVFPHSQTPPADPIALTCDGPGQPAVDPVPTNSPQPETTNPVESFWLRVLPSCPLPIDSTSSTTAEVVREAIGLGISQNQMVFKLFCLRSKGNRQYESVVELIQTLSKETSHE